MVTKSDLRPGQDYGFLYCWHCDEAEYSADSRDYWFMEDDEPMLCGGCQRPMSIMRRECQLIEVKS